MTRFAIDRKNRDRKGGHECTPIRKGPWAGADMKVARSVIKRYDKRLLRRQHSKAIKEGIDAYHADNADRMGWFYDMYGTAQVGAEDYQEYLSGYYESDPYDTYFDDEDFDDGGPYNGLDDGFSSFGPDDDYPFVYRARPVARFQDQVVAEQLTDEIRRGMVCLDMEVIEQRDAGKTLGQLLRERLQSPF